MKVADLWQNYLFYTQSLSENCRKLAFAGAAICWFFKSSTLIFPPAIMGALIFIVLFFLFDIFQYLVAAILLRIWTRSAENKMWKLKGNIDEDVEKPAWLDTPAYVFFLLKLFSLITSFVFIIYEFLVRIMK